MSFGKYSLSFEKFSMSFTQKSAPRGTPVFIGVSEGLALEKWIMNNLYINNPLGCGRWGKGQSFVIFMTSSIVKWPENTITATSSSSSANMTTADCCLLTL